MTKLTFRLTTEQDREYINGMITCMLADYEHGYLSGLEVDVSGDEGSCRIRKGRKNKGRRQIPKELKIPDFMRRPIGHAADTEGLESQSKVPDFIKHPITCADDAKGREFLTQGIGGGGQ